MKKAICIGSATKDEYVELAQTTIVETPENLTQQRLMGLEFGAKIYAEQFRQELGGSAVNVASGLQLCGIKPIIFSRVSRGETGKWILKQIGKRKLKKNYMQQNGNVESQISIIISDQKHGDHVILRTGDSVELFDMEKALAKFHEKVDLIFVGSQKAGWKKGIDLVISFSKKKKALLALNPSGYQISNDPQQLIEIFSDLDVLFLNKDEAIELVKNSKGVEDENIDFLMSTLLDKGCRVVVITDGENGAYVADNKNFFHLPTIAHKVVDTTGAGDAFASGFLASFCENQDLKKSLVWGSANSAAAVSKKGATNGLINATKLGAAENKYLKIITNLS